MKQAEQKLTDAQPCREESLPAGRPLGLLLTGTGWGPALAWGSAGLPEQAAAAAAAAADLLEMSESPAPAPAMHQLVSGLPHQTDWLCYKHSRKPISGAGLLYGSFSYAVVPCTSKTVSIISSQCDGRPYLTCKSWPVQNIFNPLSGWHTSGCCTRGAAGAIRVADAGAEPCTKYLPSSLDMLPPPSCRASGGHSGLSVGQVGCHMLIAAQIAQETCMVRQPDASPSWRRRMG